MHFSIIIPAYNEEKLLPECLKTIAKATPIFTQAGHTLETIVCDNNSTDQTSAVAQQLGAKVVFEPINQIARARNTGASIATGDFLIFIDADSTPSETLFRELLTALENPKIVGIGALVNMEVRQKRYFLVLHLWRIISRIFRWAPGSFVFCRRDLFQELGGFNTELYASEEIDFSKRYKKLAKKRGLRLTILRAGIDTSNRKLHLYDRKYYQQLFLNYLRYGNKMLRDKSSLPIWYDGKR